jgi:hypothetical protein
VVTNDNITEDEIEEIIDDGELVFENYWESDIPGAGIDAESIIKFRNCYYACPSSGEFYGPYDTLDEALAAGEATWFGETSVAIESSELSAEQLTQKLNYIGNRDLLLKINGETWQVTAAGEFKRVTG